jgi:nucleoside-diphosphate-sugar epimerase
VRATIELMEAPAASIAERGSYNLAGVSFTPAELAAEIRRHRPSFEVAYEPDFRQAIAASWPNSIDDSVARRDWGWQPEYGLAEITADMLKNLAYLATQGESHDRHCTH